MSMSILRGALFSLLFISLMSLFTLLIISSISSATTYCNTGADQEPCDGIVNITELTDHINAWYKCSACVPDLFQAIEAYYGTSHVPSPFDGWRVLPIRSEEEFNQGMTGGEAEQHPHSIARSLDNPDVIYWSHDVGQVWKSPDAGDTWKKTLGKNLSLIHGQSIEVDPVDPDIVFVIMDTSYNWLINPSYEGLYRSSDGGDNWEQVLSATETINNIYRHNIAYDLASADGSGARIWYAAFPNEGLYQSDDYGDTWNLVADLSGHNPVYQIQVHPTNGRVYLASDQGLYYSDSLGSNLQRLGNLPSGAVSSVQINSQNPDIVYAALYGQGLYKSTDGGNAFSLLRSFDVANVFINPGYPDTVYLVGQSSNTIISHDGGNTWITDMQTVPAPGLGRAGSGWKGRIAGDLSGIVPNPNDPDEAVAFSRATIWKTSDGGNNFVDSSTLFTGYAASWWDDSFEFDRYDPDRFATFNCDVAVVVTNNRGDYFDSRANGIWNWYSSGLISWIGSYSGDFQPIPGSDVMVASVGGYFDTQLMRTTDEGVTWELVTSGEANEDMNLFVSFHPDDPDLVYAGDKISHDAGQTFSHVDFGAYDGYDPYIIGLCLSNPDTVYALSKDAYHVLRSDDRGVNWYEYDAGGGGARHRRLDSLPTFAVDPVDCDRVYGMVDYDLAVFDGGTWRKTGVLDLAGYSSTSELGNFVRSVAIDPNNNSIIYAGMFAAGISDIWRSQDGGYTWEDISYNHPRVGAGSMKVNPHTGELLIGSGVGTWIFPPPYESQNLIYDKAEPMPSCHDGLRNGDETGIDSGGSCTEAPPSCPGTDSSCGVWPDCENCNDVYDGCNGYVYEDYACSDNSCILDSSDDCSDCSCSCGGYDEPESIANGNCGDGIDNDCDGHADLDDSDCGGGPAEADYYVDVNLADDCIGNYSIVNRDCSGDNGTAYNTLQEVADIIEAGETVLVRGGIYEQQITLPKNHGNALDGYITYKAYPGEKVVLTGLKTITGPWTRCSSQQECDSPAWDNIYYFDIPGEWGLTSDPGYIEGKGVFFDDEKIIYAHWPDQYQIFWPWNTSIMYKPTEEGGRTAIIDSVHLTQDDDFWNDSYIKIKDKSKGEGHIKRVADFEKSSAKITFDGSINSDIEIADSYAIMNCLYALDKAGEFVIDFDSDPKRLYIYFNDGDSPANHKIQLTVLGSALRFYTSSSTHTNLEYIIIDGFEIYGYRGNGISVRYTENSNYIIRNNKIHRNSGSGLYIINPGSTNALIENNEILYNKGTGISIDNFRNSSIINNTIVNNHVDGIKTGVWHDSLLEGNSVLNHSGNSAGHWDAIQCTGYSTNITFRNNIVLRGGLQLANSHDFKFIGNVFAQVSGHYPINGVSENGIFIKNSCLDNLLSCYTGGPVSVVRENIFDKPPGLSSVPDHDYNFFIGNLPSYAGPNSKSGTVDFVDREGGDYTPIAGQEVCTMSETGTYVGALPCV